MYCIKIQISTNFAIGVKKYPYVIFDALSFETGSSLIGEVLDPELAPLIWGGSHWCPSSPKNIFDGQNFIS